LKEKIKFVMQDKSKTIPIIDLKGINCPLPVLKTRKALRGIEGGDEIWVETTDPMAVIDIPNYCNEYGHSLLNQEEGKGCHRFHIARAEDFKG
jgi:tRNA 2-thiouridine synthesizing protein A